MSHRHILPLLAAAALFGAGCNRQKPVTVTTEKAQRRNLTEVMTGSGKLQPVMQVKISSEVAGEIIDLPVKEGHHCQPHRSARDLPCRGRRHQAESHAEDGRHVGPRSLVNSRVRT